MDAHPFVRAALDRGLLKPAEPATLFVPELDPSTTVLFEEVWAQHVTLGRAVLLANASGTEWIHTESQTSYLLRLDEPIHLGGVPITHRDYTLGACVIHRLATPLPRLRLAPGVVTELRTVYLAGETIRLAFVDAGLPHESRGYTLRAALTDTNRIQIGEVQQTPWLGNGTQLHLLLPQVASMTHALVWIQLHDNERHCQLLNCLLGRAHLTLHPTCGPELVLEHLVPAHGRARDEVVLFGAGFEGPLTVRFGDAVGSVVKCGRDYMRCLAPDHPPGPCTVRIERGDLFADGQTFTYL